MRVGFLHDDPGYIGGAELTMREFAAAKPSGIEVAFYGPDEIGDADRYVIGNCRSYPERPAGIRYLHDMSGGYGSGDTLIFCSPLQRSHYDNVDGHVIPPALDLARFKAASNGHRKGAVCVGRMAYGKGLELLAEYPEPVDVYSIVPVASEGSVRYRGASADVAETLAQYERFVFLPTALEPFGRAVVEAWAAGLTLVINRNVGAAHWIANAQEKLNTAAADFWDVVTG